MERETLRQEKRQKFLEDRETKLLALDNLVKEKELELRNHYLKLEEQLKNNHQ